MKTLSPYLSFDGKCEEAFNYYKSIFGGEFAVVVRYKDIPIPELAVPDFANEKIMHIVFSIGKNTFLMGADALKEFQYTPVTSKDITLSIDIHDEKEAMHVFKSLSEEGNVTVPIAKTFWAELYGLCTDKFGIHWMISSGEGGV